MIGLRSATRVADVFWPTFAERDGVVLLAGTVLSTQRDAFPNDSEFEGFYSHTHVLDIVRHAIPTVIDPEFGNERPDPAHPEFAAAWALAKRVGQMWLGKLAQDFPAWRFRVFVTRDDDPIVRFHRVRDADLPWLSDAMILAQVRDDVLMVLDTVAAARGPHDGAPCAVAG